MSQIVSEVTSLSPIFTDHQSAGSTKTAAIAGGIERAFRDLLATVTASERTMIIKDLRQRPARQLDTSPAAVEAARRLFSF